MKTSAPSGSASPASRSRQDATADPAHHLADQMAIGIGVVGVTGPRLPPGRSGGQGGGHALTSPTGRRWSAARRWPAPPPGGTAPGAASPPPCRRRRTRARRPTSGSSRPISSLVDQLEGQQSQDRLTGRVVVHQRVETPRRGMTRHRRSRRPGPPPAHRRSGRRPPHRAHRARRNCGGTPPRRRGSGGRTFPRRAQTPRQSPTRAGGPGRERTLHTARHGSRRAAAAASRPEGGDCRRGC